MRRYVRLGAVATLLALAGCSTGSAPEEPEASAGQTSETSAAEPEESEPEESEPEPSETEQPADDGAYVDDDGFSISFPSDWAIRTDFGGLEVFGTPPEQLAADFADNIGVLLDDTTDESITVEEYLDLSVSSAPSILADFELVELDADAGTMEYTGSGEGFQLHFLALVRIKDGKAFTATFTATQDTYDAGVDDALAIMETLETT